MPDDGHYTAQELCAQKLVGVSPKTIQNMKSDGRLKLGRHVFMFGGTPLYFWPNIMADLHKGELTFIKQKLTAEIYPLHQGRSERCG